MPRESKPLPPRPTDAQLDEIVDVLVRAAEEPSVQVVLAQLCEEGSP
jgi:hypothetical protein